MQWNERKAIMMMRHVAAVEVFHHKLGSRERAILADCNGADQWDWLLWSVNSRHLRQVHIEKTQIQDEHKRVWHWWSRAYWVWKLCWRHAGSRRDHISTEVMSKSRRKLLRMKQINWKPLTSGNRLCKGWARQERRKKKGEVGLQQKDQKRPEC